MTRIASLLVMAASLGGLALAQTASVTAPVLVQVVGAEMSALCRGGDVARARKISEACDGKQQCSYTPDVADAAAEACARDSMLLWRCGETGATQSMPLAREAGQSREISMQCQQPVLAAAPSSPPVTAPPSIVMASTVPSAEGPETITVTTPRPTAPLVQPPVRGSEAQIESEAAAIQKFMQTRGPARQQGTADFLAALRAERAQPRRDSAAGLLPGDRGVFASAPTSTPSARIRIVRATWGGNCRQTDGNETRRLSRACNTMAQCIFPVSGRAEGEAADACARDYQIVWTCGGDSQMHATTLPPARQSREVRLVCPE